MQQVADWLKKLGLSEYTERFAENRIDFSVLRDLTDQHLKDLGVVLGDRLKLLRAIGELGITPNAAAPAPTPVRPMALATATPPQEAAGERRYLTVMFCDLVDSTGIAARLDAEEWRDLVGAYIDAASAAVAEMGGHVAKKLGDGLMSLFGYPVAQENDAERAARAALAIQRALTELNRKNDDTGKPVLAARIGLETGPAVVDAAGEIYGDVANIAARVQALAEPGTVLVTARVQRQVAGLFVAEERGTHTLKGVPEPTALFKLVRASGGGRRSGQRRLTPLVGRDEEIAMLTRRWERARQGDGQLVMIVGEPGLGKSRLIEEFHSRLAETPHTWVEWSCSQLLQNTPLYPIAEWGRARFGGADVPAEQRLAELESALAQVKLDPAENASLLAPLLDIPLPQGRTPALAPEELRRRQLAALTNWVIAGAKVQPVVLAFEDLHWADPTTLDVLRSIAERGAPAPLYIVATTRPEFRPHWSMRSHHATISLAPLDRQQVRDMVAELSARHALAKDVVEDVAARTGGVPLFIEEVTRLLLEGGEQGGSQAIPPTLQQSLMARLDRLGPAREVAQIGSVIGRGFSYALFRDVAGMEDPALQAALEKLAEADIMLVQGLPPESDYRFKHALIQDAAYENLLKSRRQVLHRRVAEILRDRFADTAAAEPEVLAHHFTQASLTDAAIEWWGKAGDQALRRSAFQEAISHLGKAIEMADEADASSASSTAIANTSTSQRLKLQTTYGNALISARGYQAPETTAAFARARELAAEIEDASERVSVHYGQWAGCFVRAELRPMRELVQTLLSDCADRAASSEAGVAYRLSGETNWFEGKFVEARTDLERALAIFDPERDHELAFRFGQDVIVTANLFLACVLWPLGEVDRARKLAEEMVVRAVRGGHIATIAWARAVCALFEVMCGNPARATPNVTEMVAVAREHGMKLWMAFGSFLEPWAHSHAGNRDASVEAMRCGITMLEEQGVSLYGPLLGTALARAEAEASQFEAALATIDRAIAATERSGQRWYEAETHRIRGEILLKRDPANTAPADEAFLTAIAVAQGQKARSFELHAALSLAKLFQSTGRPADAHAALVPALAAFSPTPEFPEIEEAQTLLAALADTDEVKNAAAARQRRLKLQTSYGQAMMLSRGFGAEETRAAFNRAQELATGAENAAERFDTYYGLWVSSLLRGDLGLARKTAETFRREANSARRMTEAGVASRNLGMTCLFQGDLTNARVHLEEALRIYDPERDREAKFRFGTDPGAARGFLAHANWVLGEVGRGRELIDEAVARSVESDHAPTLAYVYFMKAMFEIFRCDRDAVLSSSQALVELSRDHQMGLYLGWGLQCHGWAGARLGDREAGITELRQALAAYLAQGNKLFAPFFQGALAELEAESQDADGALSRIDEGLALANETGEHWTDAFLHRIRGEILLKRDAANTAPAEEAFLTAIAIAREQKARSFELRAATSLARLWRDRGKRQQAHDLLAPVYDWFTEGFDTLDLKGAKALLSELA